MCRVYDWFGVPSSVLSTNQRPHGDILTIRACLRLPSRPRAYPKFFETIGYLPISSSPPARGGPGHLGVSCPVCVLHAGEQTGENVSSINFSIFSENPGKRPNRMTPTSYRRLLQILWRHYYCSRHSAWPFRIGGCSYLYGNWVTVE
jgi:hypothetical protein